MIIGFVGLKGSGKTTACNIIKKHIPGVVQHNFKDALVAEIKKNFPDLLNELSNIYQMDINDLFKFKPPAMRYLMQNYGTEVCRGKYKSYWVVQWVEGLINFSDNGIILVDDVRFLNEAEAIRMKGGEIIRLVREDMINTDNHQSEVEQDLIVANYVIKTKEGEEDLLEEKLMEILNEI